MTDRWRLTAREEQICQLVSLGLQNKEIAGRLGLSPQTVKNVLVDICRKVGVEGRTRLAVRWSQRNCLCGRDGVD